MIDGPSLGEGSEYERQVDEAFRGIQAMVYTFNAAVNSITAELAMMSSLIQLTRERTTALMKLLHLGDDATGGGKSNGT